MSVAGVVRVLLKAGRRRWQECPPGMAVCCQCWGYLEGAAEVSPCCHAPTVAGPNKVEETQPTTAA